MGFQELSFAVIRANTTDANMINSKKKGNLWENRFSNWLIDNGIKAWKDGMSGGGDREKADVGNNLNLHIEVKGVKKVNLQKVWKKALQECEKTHNSPLIAIHFDGMKDDEFLIVINNYDWLDLVKGESAPIDMTYEDPKQKWAIKNLIEASKKVLKFYE